MPQPRKAKESLDKVAVGAPASTECFYVMESLPFGGDELETQPLAPKELDLLAGNFHSETPDLPSAPTATCQPVFWSMFSVNWAGIMAGGLHHWDLYGVGQGRDR